MERLREREYVCACTLMCMCVCVCVHVLNLLLASTLLIYHPYFMLGDEINISNINKDAART